MYYTTIFQKNHLKNNETGRRESGKARRRELNPAVDQSGSYEDYLKEIGKRGGIGRFLL